MKGGSLNPGEDFDTPRTPQKRRITVEPKKTQEQSKADQNAEECVENA